MTRLIAAFICFFHLVQVFSQERNSKANLEQVNFTPRQLMEDFALMREVFTTLHPALYETINKKDFDRLLDSTAMTLNRNMSVVEFYKMLALIISDIGCGHTAVGLPKKEIDYIKSFIPLKMKFLNEKAYIIKNYTTSLQLEPGQEVVSINDEALPKTVDYLFQFIQTDGTGKSNKYLMLDNKFEIYYGLFRSQPDSFKIEVINARGKRTKITVPAANVPAPPLKSANNSKTAFPFYLKMLNSSTALLTIDLFYVYDQSKKEAYPKFLDSCFTLFKKTGLKNLIIDLRQNPGGYGTWGALLYSYLADTSFSYYKKAIVATNKPLPFIKNLKLDYTEDEYRQYLSEITQSDSGELVWTNHENLKPQTPKNDRFQGDVYVLIGRKSFSTTAEFCAITYSNQRAAFIGEETGGGYYNVNGGDMAELFLPHTGIKFIIPMRKYVLAVNKILPAGSPTIPHYYVSPSISEYLNSWDTELNFTLDLIKRKIKTR